MAARRGQVAAGAGLKDRLAAAAISHRTLRPRDEPRRRIMQEKINRYFPTQNAQPKTCMVDPKASYTESEYIGYSDSLLLLRELRAGRHWDPWELARS